MNRRIFGKLTFGMAAVGVVTPSALLSEKPKLRWLRTCIREVKLRINTEGASYEEQFEGVSMMTIRGLRSDGQMFFGAAPIGCEDASPQRLRECLDAMLNDSPLNGEVNADAMRRNLLVDRYKGRLDWVEEEKL
jgi:hypothetical protein